MFVYGTSMTPTLSPTYHTTGVRDFVLFDKRNANARIARGDIVSLHAPNKPETMVVKRVIALAGDVVFLDRRRRPRSDSLVGERDARTWDAMAESGADWGPLTRDESGVKMINSVSKIRVPFGHVWLEGDNWRDSQDSNTYGPVCLSVILT